MEKASFVERLRFSYIVNLVQLFFDSLRQRQPSERGVTFTKVTSA